MKEKIQDSKEMLKKKFGFSSHMAVPHIQKVVVNIGTGKIRDNKDVIQAIERCMMLICGQKASPRPTRTAIASFKTREGMIVGYQATLRGERMYNFLDRLINFAIPRTRDFRGISLQSIDTFGNLTLGIKEHIVFPEMIGEDVRTIFGFGVTIVTNAKNREHAVELFRLLGFPLAR